MPRPRFGRPFGSTLTALALGFSSLLLPAAPLAAANVGTAPQTGAPETVIVVLRDSVGDPNAVAAEHARQHSAQVGHIYVAALKGYA
ncbi:MAG: hypothetical protein HY329_21270, partial [Chloroflexi bacterium]|nr:hypothetical protein [Chloroflexota bacterium]